MPSAMPCGSAIVGAMFFASLTSTATPLGASPDPEVTRGFQVVAQHEARSMTGTHSGLAMRSAGAGDHREPGGDAAEAGLHRLDAATPAEAFALDRALTCVSERSGTARFWYNGVDALRLEYMDGDAQIVEIHRPGFSFSFNSAYGEQFERQVTGIDFSKLPTNRMKRDYLSDLVLMVEIDRGSPLFEAIRCTAGDVPEGRYDPEGVD